MTALKCTKTLKILIFRFNLARARGGNKKPKKFQNSMKKQPTLIFSLLVVSTFLLAVDASFISGLTEVASKAKSAVKFVGEKVVDVVKANKDKIIDFVKDTAKDQVKTFFSKKNIGNLLCAPRGESGGTLNGQTCQNLGLKNTRYPPAIEASPSLGYNKDGKAQVTIGVSPLPNLVNYLYEREDVKARLIAQENAERLANKPKAPPVPVRSMYKLLLVK
ncbi:MAG: hypothetical protein VXY56_09025 [Pseudomonadota bacterium]|nr:hypothetical protein [Pseudomonadota bacterium]